MSRLAVALTRLADAPFVAHGLDRLGIDLAASPLLVGDLRMAELELRSTIKVAGMTDPTNRLFAFSDEPDQPPFDHPIYAKCAETNLKRATARVRAIHEDPSTYGSDKAFTIDESTVIARAVRVGLYRDECWVPPMLDELFRKVSRAPNTAKSVPSQSVTIALGHAVEAFPTPEAVATLREVIRDIRHAGLKKKLQRNLGGAQIGLAGRPDIALRLPVGQPMSKPQLTVFTRCLDASLALGIVFAYDDWVARLAGHAQAKTLTDVLLWRLLDGAGNSVTVLPRTDHGQWSLRDVTDAVVAAGSAFQVTLWHPLDATADEREAWRDRLAALHIKQPFKQVFREQYVVPPDELSATETAMFSGHGVSMRPLLGLARREGWRIDDAGLARSCGPWTAKLSIADQLYPGCDGGTTTGHISLWTSDGKTSTPVRLGDVPAKSLSELLRAADLLVSTSGYAVIDDDDEGQSRQAHLALLAEGPLGPMAAMRKQALKRALHGLDGLDELQFGARHLRLGSYAVHLATGRVTRDGEPVTIERPKRSKSAAVPWLPYDERLLETIVSTIIEIARHRADASGTA